jgi:hypothetical protein
MLSEAVPTDRNHVIGRDKEGAFRNTGNGQGSRLPMAGVAFPRIPRQLRQIIINQLSFPCSNSILLRLTRTEIFREECGEQEEGGALFVRHSSSRHTVRVVGRVVVTPTPTYHMSVARRRLLRLLCSTEENGNPFNVDVATMRIHALRLRAHEQSMVLAWYWHLYSLGVSEDRFMITRSCDTSGTTRVLAQRLTLNGLTDCKKGSQYRFTNRDSAGSGIASEATSSLHRISGPLVPLRFCSGMMFPRPPISHMKARTLRVLAL